MQRVITTVRTTLNDLKLAIDGTIIMSEDLRDALDSMFDAKIPKTWQKVRHNFAKMTMCAHDQYVSVQEVHVNYNSFCSDTE